jgi:excisionase family DNA binding protein
MQIDRQQSEWMAPKEVAQELRVHVSAVYRAIERGDLPALRLSEHGSLRVPRSAIEPKEQR